MSRYVLDGTWSGYLGGRDRIVHRTVISEKKALEIRSAKLDSISFTDGTTLRLTVRESEPREHIREQDEYGRLINGCLQHGVRSVEALLRKEKGNAA